MLDQIEPAALARVPILDRRFVTSCTYEDGQTQEAWFVGQTGESAMYTAGILDVQAGSETAEEEQSVSIRRLPFYFDAYKKDMTRAGLAIPAWME